MEELNLKLQGMSCAYCANSIEQAILKVPGVVNCNVNFSTDRATVRYDAQQTNGNLICKAVADVGYEAQIISADLTMGNDLKTAQQQQLQFRHLQCRVLIGVILSLLLVIDALSNFNLKLPFLLSELENPWIQLVLAAPVQFWAGKEFH